MAAWRIILHAFMYCLLVVALLASKGALKDMDIFFLIMKDAGCRRVAEILGYHNLDETRRELVAKYDEMEKILQEFIAE